MTYTENFNLNKAEGTDLFNELTINNPAMDKVDAQMFKNQNRAVQTSVHTKTGTVHSLVKEIADATTFKFTATADYTTGDTFTVNGTAIAGRMTDGTSLPNGAFKIGNNVMCMQDSGVLTVMVSSSHATTADKLQTSAKIGSADFDGSENISVGQILGSLSINTDGLTYTNCTRDGGGYTRIGNIVIVNLRVVLSTDIDNGAIVLGLPVPVTDGVAGSNYVGINVQANYADVWGGCIYGEDSSAAGAIAVYRNTTGGVIPSGTKLYLFATYVCK